MAPRRPIAWLPIALVAVTACAADLPVGSHTEGLVGCQVGPCETEATSVSPSLPAQGSLGFESGILSAPSSSNAERVAIDWLASRGVRSVRTEALRPAGSGQLVRMQQVHAGLDVVGGEIAVRVDGRGQVRWVSRRDVRIAPGFVSVPSIEARAALDRALLGPRLDGISSAALGLHPQRHTELVVLAAPGMPEAKLAWHVRYSDEMARQTYRVYIDAQDGSELMRESLVRRAPEHRARVWDVSPVDGELEEVTFDAIASLETGLVDADMKIVGCVDERRCHTLMTTVGLRDVHHCEMRPTATVGEDGSFLHITPPEDHRAPEDAFAEVQLYHHLRSGLDVFGFWSGDPDFALRNPLTAIANMRVPDLSEETSYCEAAGDEAGPESELMVEENSVFWPAGDIGPVEIGDRIVMHQTDPADWSYDGEIVWHELTHAVMHTTTPLAWRFHDALGINYEPGGLHEGFGDYFSAAVSNRPVLSVYGYNGAEPSDLENHTDCGDVLTGEEHEESEAWSQTLWAIRRSLRSQPKRDMFDSVAFRTIASLGQFDGFERAQEITLAELDVAVEDFVVREDLDANAERILRDQVATAPDKFTDHGLPSCNGRVIEIRDAGTKPYLRMFGPNTFGLDRYRGQDLPSGMQIRLTLSEAVEAIAVASSGSEENDPTRKPNHIPSLPDMKLLLKEGDSPIKWSWDIPLGRHDADREAPLVFQNEGSDSASLAILQGPFEPGTYHLQLTNAGADWNLYDIEVQSGALVDLDKSAGFGRGGDLRKSTGCATRDAMEGSRAPAMLGFLALLALRRRLRLGRPA